MQVVFVIAPDWTMRTAVRAELRELGIDALRMDSADDASRAIVSGGDAWLRRYSIRDS